MEKLKAADARITKMTEVLRHFRLELHVYILSSLVGLTVAVIRL